MIIKKTLNDYNTFDIDLIKDNKILSIYQSGDDINFSCKFDNNSKISNIDFSISNEDNIYYIFNKLYENIINGNVLDENINLNEVKKRIEFQKNMSYYNSLVKDNIITILSDAYPISSPNILKINKNDNEIILSFYKIGNEYPKSPYYIPINIRQSGSRIYEFCIPFKTVFDELQNIEDKNMKMIKTI